MCSSTVRVTLTVTAPRRFEQRHGNQLSGGSHFAFAITDPAVRDVKYASDSDFEIFGQSGDQSPLRVGHHLGYTRISGIWQNGVDQVGIAFRARWSTRRSGWAVLGRTCYVDLPAVTGVASERIADVLQTPGSPQRNFIHTRDRQHHRNLFADTIVRATTTLRTDGDVDTNLTRPAPIRVGASEVKWACVGRGPFVRESARTPGSEDLPPGRRFFERFRRKYSVGQEALGQEAPILGLLLSAQLPEQYGAGCESRAVVAESNAETGRDVLLLALGVFLAVAADLLIAAFRALRA
jgi:hypothetical protein